MLVDAPQCPARLFRIAEVFPPSMNRLSSSFDAYTAEKRARFWLLLAVQTVSVLLLLWSATPIYRTILAAPGQKLEVMPGSPVVIVLSLVAFHGAYWYRLVRVPIVIGRHGMLLSHLAVFLGRLSFIFGGALFALVIYRHLPDLSQAVDPIQLVSRMLAMLAIQFSLFCYTLELERVGTAMRPAG